MRKSKMNLTVVEAKSKGYLVKDSGQVLTPKGQVLQVTANSRGYKAFNINRSTPVFVHKLVAYQKYGESALEEGIEVRHKDGNKDNNKWDNILIGTPSQNSMDKKRSVRLSTARAAASYRRKLSSEEVIRLRDLRRRGYTYAQICKEFGIAKSTASYIVNGRTYKQEEC